jgi:transcriptional regulator GlxA family with amidase domain
MEIPMRGMRSVRRLVPAVALTLPALALVAMRTSRHAAAAYAVAPDVVTVAFVVTNNANVIDLAGPWEVFQDATWHDASGQHHMPFRLFTVSESRSPVTMTNGLRVVPDYTFETAPHADVVVVGAQEGAPGLANWLRARSTDSRVVMSVCTGAFKLADAGLLDGKKATTHHEFWDAFASKYPKVHLQRGDRFVQSDAVIYTAGGLTSGIDLALHIVEKFYGRDVADRTARYMEYERGTTNGGMATP